jgi:hypothetical protein
MAPTFPLQASATLTADMSAELLSLIVDQTTDDTHVVYSQVFDGCIYAEPSRAVPAWDGSSVCDDDVEATTLPVLQLHVSADAQGFPQDVDTQWEIDTRYYHRITAERWERLLWEADSYYRRWGRHPSHR